jgi:nucleoid-associated protein YejK
MMSVFSDLTINRLAVHEVFVRDEDMQPVPPRLSESLVVLEAAGLEAIRERIIRAMGSDSKSIEMSVMEDGVGSTFQLCANLIEANDDDFLALSKQIAQKLAGAQTARNIPGGVVVVLRGTAGSDAKPFAGVIKAEVHTGFIKESGDGGPLIRYLTDLLLTPQQKLHKVGIFLRTADPADEDDPVPDDFSVYVFDAQMSGAEVTTAANYFYERFLGCTAAPSARKRTRDFYTHARKFLESAEIDDDKKVEGVTALHVYLRSNRGTIQSLEFAMEHLPPELHQSFVSYLEENDVPQVAIQKDIGAIRTKLRIRRLNFTHDVRILAPADRFGELVQVNGVHDGVTVVHIRAKVTG